MAEQEWNTGRLLQTSSGYWQACTLHTSVRLEIFTAIGPELVSGDEIAQKAGADVGAVKRLLNALTAMGLLTRQQGLYANTAAAESLLVKDSPDYIGHIILHHQHLVEAWSQLTLSVKTGKQVKESSSFSADEDRETFLMGMFNMAMGAASRVADKVDLSGRSHLLDLGGGPGTYAVHFCLANPNLRATVYDLPTTRPIAEKIIARFGLLDRVGFVAGNYIEDDLAGSYDVAWLSHIIHGEDPGDSQKIIEKAASALTPGGLILIHDFLLNDTLDGPLFPALFSLNMLLNTEQGRSYSESEITSMMARAGFRDIRRIAFQGPNDSGIVAGDRQGRP